MNQHLRSGVPLPHPFPHQPMPRSLAWLTNPPICCNAAPGWSAGFKVSAFPPGTRREKARNTDYKLTSADATREALVKGTVTIVEVGVPCSAFCTWPTKLYYWYSGRFDGQFVSHFVTPLKEVTLDDLAAVTGVFTLGPRTEHAVGGLLHRNRDRPAVIEWEGKREEWWRAGVLHRENGPAIIDRNLQKLWFFEEGICVRVENRHWYHAALLNW